MMGYAAANPPYNNVLCKGSEVPHSGGFRGQTQHLEVNKGDIKCRVG